MDVDRPPPGLSAYVSSEGRIKYDRPVRVASICNLDIFYFPFDQQNCTFTFTSFLYTGVYFALCLSLMVLSLLETIFITYLLHLATTQPPPMPRWLHSLLLHCTSPAKCCPTAPQKRNKDLGLTPAHLPGLKEPVEFVGKVLGPQEAELNAYPGSVRICQEDEVQKQHLVSLWVQFSHMMDTLLFRLYLLFMATSIITVITLWNT